MTVFDLFSQIKMSNGRALGHAQLSFDCCLFTIHMLAWKKAPPPCCAEKKVPHLLTRRNLLIVVSCFIIYSWHHHLLSLAPQLREGRHIFLPRACINGSVPVLVSHCSWWGNIILLFSLHVHKKAFSHQNPFSYLLVLLGASMPDIRLLGTPARTHKRKN